MTLILIAEDDTRIAAFVEKGLKAAGYGTDVVHDGATALAYAMHGEYDLMILDIGLPQMDGLEVIEAMRGQGSQLGVIFLTARDSLQDMVSALESGGNDYITKPFRFEELLARIKVRLRDAESVSATPATSSLLETAGMSIDFKTRTVRVSGKTVELTAREFSLMEVFMSSPQQVLSRQQLLSHVWGVDFETGSNVVDVAVRSLRKKIGAETIETVRGMGYRLVGVAQKTG